VEVIPGGPDEIRDPGVGPAGGTGTDDEAGQRPSALVTAAPRDVAQPIVVPNTLWTSASPGAYASSAPAFTHLRELAHDELANADTARWGQLVKERRGQWPDRPIAPNVPEDV
jgi:hypothetical protein